MLGRTSSGIILSNVTLLGARYSWLRRWKVYDNDLAWEATEFIRTLNENQISPDRNQSKKSIVG
jgi:hypothetical protein